jgi:hypothetical protein
MCCVMKYVQTTRDVFCCKKEGKDLPGKCSVVKTVSPTYKRIEWYDGRIKDVVSDYNATAACET